MKDPRLANSLSVSKLTRKMNSAPIEASVRDFIDRIVHDFVSELWYSSITPDKEAPELIRVLLLDVIGEISLRIKEINLVDLLTRCFCVTLVSHPLFIFHLVIA